MTSGEWKFLATTKPLESLSCCELDARPSLESFRQFYDYCAEFGDFPGLYISLFIANADWYGVALEPPPGVKDPDKFDVRPMMLDLQYKLNVGGGAYVDVRYLQSLPPGESCEFITVIRNRVVPGSIVFKLIQYDPEFSQNRLGFPVNLYYRRVGHRFHFRGLQQHQLPPPAAPLSARPPAPDGDGDGDGSSTSTSR